MNSHEGSPNPTTVVSAPGSREPITTTNQQSHNQTSSQPIVQRTPFAIQELLGLTSTASNNEPAHNNTPSINHHSPSNHHHHSGVYSNNASLYQSHLDNHHSMLANHHTMLSSHGLANNLQIPPSANRNLTGNGGASAGHPGHLTSHLSSHLGSHMASRMAYFNAHAAVAAAFLPHGIAAAATAAAGQHLAAAAGLRDYHQHHAAATTG